MHTIKQYNSKTHTQNNYDLFILCKGKNSGKPLAKPCPNCFVINCNSEAEKLHWYCVCLALWKSNTFHFYLIGSVIPYIRIKDFKNILQLHEHANITEVIKQVAAIEELQSNLKLQLEKLQQYKIALLKSALK